MLNIGNICLVIACCLGASTVFESCKQHLRTISFAQFAMLTLALLKLINVHINTDYTFTNVLENSHTLVPMLYKITGVWANHEGSMLLLVWIYSLFVYIFASHSPESQSETSIQSSILALLLLFVLIASNPFTTLHQLFPEGRGLNPLLQDVGLSIHPPFLYAGYVGFIIPYSIVLRALINRSPLPASIRMWALIPWSLLTFGITLGTWWSYRELGWGGFWFWDPVENISLIVWISGTILLHSILVKQYTYWAILFGLLTFLLALLGMFLVRGGILSSVHSFAYDPKRGLFILAIFALLFVHNMFFYIKNVRCYIAKPMPFKNVFDKSTAIFITNALLLITLFIILLAVLYPPIYQLITGKTIAIGEEFYQSALVIPGLGLVAILALYSSKTVAKFIKYISTALLLTAAIYLYSPIHSIVKVLFIFSGITLCIATTSLAKKNLVSFLAHTGFGILVVACSLYYAWHFDASTIITKNSTVRIGRYNVTLKDIAHFKQDNFLGRRAVIEVGGLGVLAPETRFYPVEKSFTTESSVLHTKTGDLYATIGEVQNGTILLRLQFKPFIYLVWFGLCMMALSVPIGIKKWHQK